MELKSKYILKPTIESMKEYLKNNTKDKDIYASFTLERLEKELGDSLKLIFPINFGENDFKKFICCTEKQLIIAYSELIKLEDDIDNVVIVIEKVSKEKINKVRFLEYVSNHKEYDENLQLEFEIDGHERIILNSRKNNFSSNGYSFDENILKEVICNLFKWFE
ncbi:hypothetical protein N2W50_000304 [Clostridium perfringens]|nr:hypothetical protein [Clostridium perfringens]ELC8416105.1 hypothetical protein [Clostridium perfringens]